MAQYQYQSTHVIARKLKELQGSLRTEECRELSGLMAEYLDWVEGCTQPVIAREKRTVRMQGTCKIIPFQRQHKIIEEG